MCTSSNPADSPACYQPANGQFIWFRCGKQINGSFTRVIHLVCWSREIPKHYNLRTDFGHLCSALPLVFLKYVSISPRGSLPSQSAYISFTCPSSARTPSLHHHLRCSICDISGRHLLVDLPGPFSAWPLTEAVCCFLTVHDDGDRGIELPSYSLKGLSAISALLCPFTSPPSPLPSLLAS